MGVDAGGDEARRGDHADHDRGGSGRPARPDRPRAAPASWSPTPSTPTSSTTCRVTTPGSRSARRGPEPTAGATPRRRRRLAGAEHPGTGPQDRLLLYFTSGTTSQAQAGRAHPGVLPGRPPDHDVLAGPAARATCTSTSPRPGWAKHAWSCFFAPWIAEATSSSTTTTRFDARRAAAHSCGTGGDHVLRAADGVADADPRRPVAGPGALREVIGAGEPLNPEVIAQVREKWGLTLRDGFGQTETTAMVGNTPGSVVKAGSMGRPLPGLPVVLVDPRHRRARSGAGARARSASTSTARGPPAAPDGRLPRRPGAQRGGDGRRLYHTGDVASRGRGRLPHLRRAHRRRVQGLRLQGQPVRAGVAC